MIGRRPLTPVEQVLGYRFRNLPLLEEALTHSSYANEQNLPADYERLEFLGDAVLGVLTAEWLFTEHPELPEGELSKLKSALVSGGVLAERARRLGIGAEMRLGVGEERSGGREKAGLLADVMEAILGALWLDGGLKVARGVVRELLEETLAQRGRLRQGDFKTRLQELVQGWGLERPIYAVVAEVGPDHDKEFVVEARLGARVVGRGEGRSKKAAQQEAAARALDLLEGEGPPVTGEPV